MVFKLYRASTTDVYDAFINIARRKSIRIADCYAANKGYPIISALNNLYPEKYQEIWIYSFLFGKQSVKGRILAVGNCTAK